MSKKRFEAWWHNEMIDRPVVTLSCPREKPRWPLRSIPEGSRREPARGYLDPQLRVDSVENMLASTDYFGDDYPVTSRGINTGYLGSFAGAEPEFTPDTGTVWIEPFVTDWTTAPEPRFDTSRPLFQKIVAVSKALAENAQGRYMLAIPDHLDAVTTMSQMRGVENMCLDLMDNPEAVYAYRDAIVKVWLESYDFWWQHDRDMGFEGITNWAGAFSGRRGGVLQCDFSYMISPAMFEELVRPELATEGGHLDASLYHWDGPGQAGHFDILSEMPEITAIQWIPGAGNPTAAQDPAPVIRAQQAGKPVQVHCCIGDLDAIFEVLAPKGVMLRMTPGDIKPDADVCRTAVKRIEQWAVGRPRATRR